MEQQLKDEVKAARLEMQEQTLQSVGQELHDNVGQALSLVKMGLNSGTTESLVESKKLVSVAIQDIRRIAYSLNLNWATECNLNTFVTSQTNQLKALGYQTTFSTEDENLEFHEDQKIVLFRIIQEIIHNIVKHAEAQHVTIEITNKQIVIADDGKGFDPNVVKAGIGLKSIQNRVELIGVKVKIESFPHKGTKIFLEFKKAV
jgi:signal transduction histidine kinase